MYERFFNDTFWCVVVVVPLGVPTYTYHAYTTIHFIILFLKLIISNQLLQKIFLKSWSLFSWRSLVLPEHSSLFLTHKNFHFPQNYSKVEENFDQSTPPAWPFLSHSPFSPLLVGFPITYPSYFYRIIFWRSFSSKSPLSKGACNSCNVM